MRVSCLAAQHQVLQDLHDPKQEQPGPESPPVGVRWGAGPSIRRDALLCIIMKCIDASVLCHI